MTAGYSKTPLAKKLSVKEGHKVGLLNEPEDFRSLLVELPDGVTFGVKLDGQPDVVIAFYTERSLLSADLARLGEAVFPDRVIWLAWPKQSSGVETDLNGNIVREEVLATKLVDVKVAALSEIWSGLKVVWRKEHR